MKPKLIVHAVLLILGMAMSASAQELKRDLFRDDEGNTYHQLFLDFHVTELVELKYAADNTPVDGTLSADGYSVIIKNYPGDRSVRLIIRDDTGQQKELTKSRCFIDPVILNL